MTRLRVRVALAVVGTLLFTGYLAAAVLAVGVLAVLLVDPPDSYPIPTTTGSSSSAGSRSRSQAA